MIKTFVISLERDKERRTAVCRSLDKFGVDYELFPAVWGADVDRNDPKIFNEEKFVLVNNALSKITVKGRLTDGELGCALSHLQVYEKIVAQNLPGAIVVEDDFEPYNNYPQVFAQILSVLPQAEVINGRSVQRLGLRQSWFTRKKIVHAEGQDYQVYLAGIPGLDWLLNRRRRVESGRCYYVSQSACRRLLHLGYPVRMEADRLLGMKAFNKLCIYLVYPFLSVEASHFASLIGTGRHQKAY